MAWLWGPKRGTSSRSSSARAAGTLRDVRDQRARPWLGPPERKGTWGLVPIYFSLDFQFFNPISIRGADYSHIGLSPLRFLTFRRPYCRCSPPVVASSTWTLLASRIIALVKVRSICRHGHTVFWNGYYVDIALTLKVKYEIISTTF